MKNQAILCSPWLEQLPRPGYDASMCPGCGGKSIVQKTGSNAGGQLVRYRVCEECGCRYKTVELLCVGDRVALNYRRKEK